MDIKDKIKLYMSELGWTEYRLSKESGLSQSTVRNLFVRNNAPTFQTLEAICKAFNITLSQFFSDGQENVELSEDQRQLLLKWLLLNKEQQRILLELMDSIK